MSPTKTQTATTKRIHKVVIQHMIDSDPDISYLEQDDFLGRLEQYNNGVFEFIGIRARAEYCVGTGDGYSIVQEVTSGGLWGIESDSNAEYLKDIEQEELNSLRGQLSAIGFSKRAISAAFRNIEHNEG